mmetsp:Transcript_30606/g.72838  ORF Transcript_30606/g.72838 Transcript_30606/m.72838 type:complete len:301 (+) Transcript_30606:107-1009(+)
MSSSTEAEPSDSSAGVMGVSNDNLEDLRASVAAGGVDLEKGPSERGCSRKCLVATSLTQLLLIVGLVVALLCVLLIPNSDGERVVESRYSTRPHHISASVTKNVDRAFRQRSFLGEPPQWSLVGSPENLALRETMAHGEDLENVRMARNNFVLWNLHFSLNGSTGIWRDSGADSCLWDGVRCDLAGRVADLDLEDKDFSGELPRTLYMLQHLRSLSLKGNQDLGATEGLPTFMIHMPLLHSINVCGTGYTNRGINAICAKNIETSISSSSSTSTDTSGDVPPEIIVYADFSCDCCQACPM